MGAEAVPQATGVYFLLSASNFEVTGVETRHCLIPVPIERACPLLAVIGQVHGDVLGCGRDYQLAEPFTAFGGC